jgi:hypothetical protein
LAGTGSTLFSDRLFWRQLTLFLDRIFWRQLKFGGNWLQIIFRRIVLENLRELAPHYFLADCFGGSSDLVRTGLTLFSNRLFCRQLKFGGNWLHIIFRQIVLEAAHIIFRQIVLEAAQFRRELAPHYFTADCFWKFGGNWLYIIIRWIVSEAAQIWRELAPHYFPTDCFGGRSNLVGTGSTLFSDRLFWRQLKFGVN